MDKKRAGSCSGKYSRSKVIGPARPIGHDNCKAQAPLAVFEAWVWPGKDALDGPVIFSRRRLFLGMKQVRVTVEEI